jgi:glycosyltransferase involved in cell wall biosynthesis
MRVLFASKWLRITGGVESYALAAARGLTESGHVVAWFGFGDDREPEFVPGGPLPAEFLLRRGTGWRGLRQAAVAGIKMFHNPEVTRCYAETLAAFNPDVVQLHNVLHHLGTQMQRMARERSIPVAAYAHDYHAVCPNYTLLRGEVAPCDARCATNSPLHAIRNRCVRRSRVLSAVSAAEFARALSARAYSEAIDRWLVPSRFMGQMLEHGGIPAVRVQQMEYCLAPEWDSVARAACDGRRFVYVGRLSYEKGVETVITMGRALPDVQFVVVGGGPEARRLRELAEGLTNVRFTGQLRAAEIRGELAAATALVVPSRWYENSPMVVREALASGLPVIGARIGGIPELIDDGVDGLLCDPVDASAFIAAARQLIDEPARAAAMGSAGRLKARARWNMRRHVDQLTALYSELVGEKASARS